MYGVPGLTLWILYYLVLLVSLQQALGGPASVQRRLVCVREEDYWK